MTTETEAVYELDNAMCVIDPGTETLTDYWFTSSRATPSKIHKHLGGLPVPLLDDTHGQKFVQLWICEEVTDDTESNAIALILAREIGGSEAVEAAADVWEGNEALSIKGRMIITGASRTGNPIPLSDTQRDALIVLLEGIQEKSKGDDCWAYIHPIASLFATAPGTYNDWMYESIFGTYPPPVVYYQTTFPH